MPPTRKREGRKKRKNKIVLVLKFYISPVKWINNIVYNDRGGIRSIYDIMKITP
jgi:hypothetical protein